MKKKEGITLIALIVTIIVMIILASIIVYSGGQIVKEAKLQTITSEMLMIQAKAETIKDKVEFTNNENQLYGTLVENPTEQEISAGIVANEWYKWDTDTFEQTGLSGIEDAKVYYVNYHADEKDNIEVIYGAGYKHIDGKIYYTLSEIKELTMEDEE